MAILDNWYIIKLLFRNKNVVSTESIEIVSIVNNRARTKYFHCIKQVLQCNGYFRRYRHRNCGRAINDAWNTSEHFVQAPQMTSTVTDGSKDHLQYFYLRSWRLNHHRRVKSNITIFKLPVVVTPDPSESPLFESFSILFFFRKYLSEATETEPVRRERSTKC